MQNVGNSPHFSQSYDRSHRPFLNSPSNIINSVYRYFRSSELGKQQAGKRTNAIWGGNLPPMGSTEKKMESGYWKLAGAYIITSDVIVYGTGDKYFVKYNGWGLSKSNFLRQAITYYYYFEAPNTLFRLRPSQTRIIQGSVPHPLSMMYERLLPHKPHNPIVKAWWNLWYVVCEVNTAEEEDDDDYVAIPGTFRTRQKKLGRRRRKCAIHTPCTDDKLEICRESRVKVADTGRAMTMTWDATALVAEQW